MLKLLAEIGPVCLDYQRKALVNLLCKRLQADEIWSFIHSKERHIRPEDRGVRSPDARNVTRDAPVEESETPASMDLQAGEELPEWARRDSNARPLAPEASALSN